MKLRSILESILTESITKSQAKKLIRGDFVWIKHSDRYSEKVKFLEFVLASGLSKDLVKCELLPESKMNVPRGYDYYPLSVVFLEEPASDNSYSKKGFLSKGVQGQRKWK